ncbi:MAG: glutathione binding-like protein [Pseudomonadota bacterium]
MALELWTAPTPNGWKISIMLEELREAGVDLGEVQVHTVNLKRGEQFSTVFGAINPNHKIPALRHDGLRVFESCAILQYLGETFPSPLLPRGRARWEVLSWLTWQGANLGPVFGNKLSYTRYLIDLSDEAKAHPLERFGTEALRLVDVLHEQLAEGPYLCGREFTVADIAAYPWVRGYKWSKIDITRSDRVVAWVERVRARPAVGRGLAYGVPADEVDRWSLARRDQYARNGAQIAAPEHRSRTRE